MFEVLRYQTAEDSSRKGMDGWCQMNGNDLCTSNHFPQQNLKKWTCGLALRTFMFNLVILRARLILFCFHMLQHVRLFYSTLVRLFVVRQMSMSKCEFQHRKHKGYACSVHFLRQHTCWYIFFFFISITFLKTKHIWSIVLSLIIVINCLNWFTAVIVVKR